MMNKITVTVAYVTLMLTGSMALSNPLHYSYSINIHQSIYFILYQSATMTYSRRVHARTKPTIRGRSEKLNEAIRNLKDSDTNIVKASAYNDRAEYFLRNGKLELALSDLNKSLSLDPAMTRPDTKFLLSHTHRLLGALYTKKKQYDSAIHHFTKAIKHLYMHPSMNDQFAQLCYQRGYAYAYKGQINKAILDFGRAIKQSPNPHYYRTRAEAYLSLKQYRKAIDDYTGAIEVSEKKNEKPLRDYFRRGMIYIRIFKNKSKGCADLRKVCALGNCSSIKQARKNRWCK